MIFALDTTVKKKVNYILMAIMTAVFYFIFTYYIVFLDIAKEDVLVATVLNIVFIFVILAVEKLEYYALKKIESKVKKGRISAIIKKISTGVSFKSALYCFYIVLLICYAILAAKPDHALLSGMEYYFKSIYYGILILVAADKFFGQVFKEANEK